MGEKKSSDEIVKQSEKFVKKHEKALQTTYQNLWDEKKMDEMSKERAKDLDEK